MAGNQTPGNPFGPARRDLAVEVAWTEEEVRACQRLRYRVFTEEFGASIEVDEPGLDRDAFDRHCRHLGVWDSVSGEPVATARLLDGGEAAEVGGFYSQTEFALDRILGRPGRFLEVGRTCVHPEYRRGSAITLLWAGLGRLLREEGVDYLIGCPSLPLAGGFAYAKAVMDRLRRHHFSGEDERVFPLRPLPAEPKTVPRAHALLPPLLNAYLRLGARVCGEPFWDRDLNVADVFIVVEPQQVAGRYKRHFLSPARRAQ